MQVSEATGHADVVYTTTDEEENIDLDDLIKEKSIALSEFSLALAMCTLGRSIGSWRPQVYLLCQSGTSNAE